ncbi:head-tail connector protein [Roseovarius phycicola]|uniref:Head-tail connector protein n=1 Tax=Roseovarius phycicola TaxID=3080976 RepID=A0ABZ2HRD5_9RHOB
MMLIEETAVSQSALPLDEFKSHLKMGTGFSDADVQDPLLESYLRAAVSAIEARTGKILITRSFSWSLTRWWDASGQALPVAPVSDVISLILRNRIDEEETIDSSHYVLERDAQRPILRPAGSALPGVPPGGVVELSFVAGYASDWGGLPADLGQAVILLAAYYYENRHDTGRGETDMPFGVKSLIERYRTVRLLSGGRLS